MLGTGAVLAVVSVLVLWQVTVSAQGDASSSVQAGKKVFDSSCAACHQANGQGVSGAFPPLAGYVPKILAKKDGRTTLEHIVLFGMTGQISADGNSYNSTMPTWGKIISDQQITDALNYIAQAWGNGKNLPKDFKPFTLAEIQKAAKAKLTPSQVHAEREKLGLK